MMFASKRNLSSSPPQQPSEKSKVDSPLSPPLSNDGGFDLGEDRTKEGEDEGEDESGVFVDGHGIDSIATLFLDFGYTQRDELRFVTTGLATDIIVNVGDVKFNLHKVQFFASKSLYCSII
ncbi:uncharacterized protein A4U43_C03F14830 [Asparagus officinalis]|uniref:Uncharacterized protein n=1 Tax=Asparagus officinalis TaxID=4686 RepID=A0A5P1FF31_ASPOF|nr:uncharacterized protein A4U43_C03F14830 [Asparagus officinalis]